MKVLKITEIKQKKIKLNFIILCLDQQKIPVDLSSFQNVGKAMIFKEINILLLH